MIERNGLKMLTVGELIAELQKMPQDLPVITEGCDCLGDAYSVSNEREYVCINRSN